MAHLVWAIHPLMSWPAGVRATQVT